MASLTENVHRLGHTVTDVSRVVAQERETLAFAERSLQDLKTSLSTLCQRAVVGGVATPDLPAVVEVFRSAALRGEVVGPKDVASFTTLGPFASGVVSAVEALEFGRSVLAAKRMHVLGGAVDKATEVCSLHSTM
jgi:hypothetical protein